MRQETKCSARQLVDQRIVQNTVHGMKDNIRICIKIRIFVSADLQECIFGYKVFYITIQGVSGNILS